MIDLFAVVDGVLQGAKGRAGWLNCDCPYCGKPAARGQVHFSYNTAGYNCFVCGAKGGLLELAQHLRVLDTTKGDYRPVQPRTVAPPVVELAAWRMNPAKLLQGYRCPERFAAWARYKPLTPATVERFDLGLGRLPFKHADGSWYMSSSQWLTVPLHEGGELVGLRGRNLGTVGPKWISASGTSYTLWGVEHVKAGGICWLCENYIDAAWLMQTYPDWSAVAIGGATTWKSAWVELLAAQRPGKVIVALDNDLPGQATGAFRDKLEQEWRLTHFGTDGKPLPPPVANGPAIANALLAGGMQSVLFRWPAEAPAKAGIDWALQFKSDNHQGERQ